MRKVILMFFWGIVLVFAGCGMTGSEQVSREQAGVVKPQDYWLLAMKFKDENNYSQAIANFQKFNESGGTDPMVFNHLADLFVKVGLLDQALESALKYVELMPQQAQGHFQLGVIYNLLEKKGLAIESYLLALDKDPQLADASFNLGYLYESDNQFSKAIEFYRKTISIKPDHAQAHYNLGNIYAGLDESSQAIAMYKKAIDLDKNYLDAYVNVSILLTKQGQFKEALYYLDEARVLGYEPPQEYLQSLEIYREGVKI